MQNLRNDTNTFYDAVADYYHLFYRDWHVTLQREGSELRRVFRDRNIKKILDTSCGTGLQAIALAKLNYEVTAADPSFKMLLKAREAAQSYDVANDITFVRAGFLELPYALVGPYDAVIKKGNALPHLIRDHKFLQVLYIFKRLLGGEGLLVIGFRFFFFMLDAPPRFVPPLVHGGAEKDPFFFGVGDGDGAPP